ncbi:MAG: HDOD domain-containing protein [Planctomycetota bacterium]
MADPTQTSPEVVLAHLDGLPTLPAVAVRLFQLTGADEAGAADLIQVLRADQSLTARILTVAASAAYGGREVSTLERAVPLIGFAGVRSIVLAASVFEVFGRRPARGGAAFDVSEFWKHALAVACAARRLAALRAELALYPEDAFVAGLLHDLGKVALSAVFPKAYERAAAQANQTHGDIADSERACLGTDHTVAGRRLAERWRLPRDLQEAIWLHHLPADALPASVTRPRLIAVVQLADLLAREQRIGYSGNHVIYDTSARLAERFGFTAAHAAAVVAALATDVADQATRLGLEGETPQGVYIKAMGRANAELGRLNAELAAGNRRLAAAARYFRAIAQFEQKLADWADPAAVVLAVAHAATEALQRPRGAAFGLRDGACAVDLCWLVREPEHSEQATQVVPIELADWVRELRGRTEATVMAAPAPVRLLLGELLTRSEAGTVWLLPIQHQGELVGGIAYVSAADEPLRLAAESEELRSFLASLGLALGRANAQAAARRLSEELAATNRQLQRAQSELLRSRALAMIAEMAAGAGHELNSPLTVISGRAQMLSAQLGDREAQRVLRVVSEKAQECSGIVTELMEFARPRTPQRAHFALRPLLEEVRAAWLERAKLPETRVRLAAPNGGDGPSVYADRGQLRAVLDEVLANAVAAVSGGQGGITLAWNEAGPGAGVEITVADEGCGMEPAVAQRAFDPFFSHRSAGRGRGLGLARAYRMIEAHGGRIWLESRPAEGTTVYIMLSAAGTEAEPA